VSWECEGVEGKIHLEGGEAMLEGVEAGDGLGSEARRGAEI
jgi:hypothetical protein